MSHCQLTRLHQSPQNVFPFKRIPHKRFLSASAAFIDILNDYLQAASAASIVKSHAIVKALAASAHEPEQAQLDLLRSLHGDGIRTFSCLLIGLISWCIAGMRALLEAFEDLRNRLTEATDRN